MKEIDRAIVDKELKFSKEVDRATVNKELQRKLKAFTRSQGWTQEAGRRHLESTGVQSN